MKKYLFSPISVSILWLIAAANEIWEPFIYHGSSITLSFILCCLGLIFGILLSVKSKIIVGVLFVYSVVAFLYFFGISAYGISIIIAIDDKVNIREVHWLISAILPLLVATYTLLSVKAQSNK